MGTRQNRECDGDSKGGIRMPNFWRRLCTIATVILLILLLLLKQFGSPVVSYRMERQVYQYLQEQGYRSEEIADIRVIYDPANRHVYTAKVVFLDHGEYTRYYYYNDDQLIQALKKIEP